ncbi:MAG: hypothetical protein ACREOO_09160 [bacterium]
MSANLHYYVLIFLVAVLFLLQFWGIVKIKRMMREVQGLYGKLSKPSLVRHTEKMEVGTFRHTCQICRHRQTFLDPSGKQVFVYRCGLSQLRIKLDDYCEKFEFDPHIADI